jgi:TatD DNase family protein
MQLIDTHAHLYSSELLENINEIVSRAKENKLVNLLMPNIDEGSITPMHQLAKDFPNYLVPMMGIHPCYVKPDFLPQINLVEKMLSENKYCAVGEIGIDLHWDKTLLVEQQQAFRLQIQLAKKYQLPIVIHARESFQEIFEILDEENDTTLKGVFHCFTGGIAEAQKILSYQGFLMGIGGVITYKNSNLSEVVKHIPLDKLVLETDSPYLPPVPFRGKTNESSYLTFIAQKLADSKGESIENISKVTTENANSLFKI